MCPYVRHYGFAVGLIALGVATVMAVLLHA